MRHNLQHLASMAFNQPLLLEPAYAQVFFSGLAEKLDIQSIQNHQGELILPEGMEELAGGYTTSRERNRPYQVMDNGVAVLPVEGTLVHKFGYMRPSSGMTGYDGIIGRVVEAMSDPDVKGILLDQDSPGGSVAGCFDTVRTLQNLEKQGGKPIWSLCFDMTCSASMAIACGASNRLITENGNAGSVGIIMAHTSYEKQLEEKGIKVTLITAGTEKANGSPYKDLPDSVLNKYKQETESLRQEFAGLVASAIGKDVNHVLETEAAVYRGKEAIDIGFADDLVNGHEAIAYFGEFLSSHNSSSIQVGVNAMSQPDNNADAAAETRGPEESVQAAPEQLATARTEERARIKSIMQCEESKGRESLANHFAFDTEMSVDAAKAALSAAPVTEKAEAHQGSALDQHMSQVDQPEVGADAGGDESTQEVDQVAEMLGSFNAATGSKLGVK